MVQEFRHKTHLYQLSASLLNWQSDSIEILQPFLKRVSRSCVGFSSRFKLLLLCYKFDSNKLKGNIKLEDFSALRIKWNMFQVPRDVNVMKHQEAHSSSTPTRRQKRQRFCVPTITCLPYLRNVYPSSHSFSLVCVHATQFKLKAPTNMTTQKIRYDLTV